MSNTSEVLKNAKSHGATSEDLLILAVKAIVASTEKLERMNVNTDSIMAKLNNGINKGITDIETLIKTEVMPKLDIEKALIESRKVEVSAKIEETKARKEMYTVKYKFYGTVATLVLGGGGLIVAIIKLIVLPWLGLPPTP